MFIGRLLALALAALALASVPDAMEGGGVGLALTLAFLGSGVGILVVASFFVKEDTGTLPAGVTEDAELTHDHIVSFAPFFDVTRGGATLRESVLLAVAATEERVVAKSYCRTDDFNLLCILAVTNRRYILCRVDRMGPALIGRATLGLIEKAPGGVFITWPIRALVYSWMRVFRTESKKMRKAMQVSDAALLSGSVEGWKTMREHTFAEVREQLEEVTLSKNGWSPGFSLNPSTKKIRKVFAFRRVVFPHNGHGPLLKALMGYAAGAAATAGWTLDVTKSGDVKLKAPAA